MWNSLGIENYIIKAELVDHAFKFFVSNLISIWYQQMSRASLLDTCKLLNPLLEASGDSLIKKVLDLIDANSESEKTIELQNDHMQLNFTKKLKVFQFRFNLTMILGDPKMLYEELTLSLIAVSKHLKTKEEKLIQMLKDKDAELAEYKSEGIQIKRWTVVTQPFIEKQFQEEFPVSHEVLKNPVSYFDNNTYCMFQKIPKLAVEVSCEGSNLHQNTHLHQKRPKMNTEVQDSRLEDKNTKPEYSAPVRKENGTVGVAGDNIELPRPSSSEKDDDIQLIKDTKTCELKGTKPVTKVIRSRPKAKLKL